MGGVSSERLISIKTGNQVYGAIKDIYDVKKILVSKNIKKLIDILVNEKPNFIFNALHGRFGEDGQLSLNRIISMIWWIVYSLKQN